MIEKRNGNPEELKVKLEAALKVVRNVLYNYLPFCQQYVEIGDGQKLFEFLPDLAEKPIKPIIVDVKSFKSEEARVLAKVINKMLLGNYRKELAAVEEHNRKEHNKTVDKKYILSLTSIIADGMFSYLFANISAMSNPAAVGVFILSIVAKSIIYVISHELHEI